jgi:hypothetical protein
MFRWRRIAELFTQLGFFVGWESQTDIGLVRPNSKACVFEVIHLAAGKHRGGKWGDFSSGSIHIGLTPGEFTCIKGLAEVECLSEFTSTNTPTGADAWEQQILNSAPQRLMHLVSNKADDLLHRTAKTRAAVDRYLEAVPDGSIKQATEILILRANDEQRNEAKRLSRTEGFICLPERHCYDLISILIATHSSHIDGEGDYWGQCPNQVRELNWRFQLLASQLYPEKGWEWMPNNGGRTKRPMDG